MLIRTLQIGIVLFWLATTGWLVQAVWFPDARHDRVELEQILDIFFNWNESNNLLILEDGKRIGQLTVNGAAGEDSKRGRWVNHFSFAGSMDSPGRRQLEGLMGATWQVTGEFERDLQMIAFRLNLRVPADKLHVTFEIDGEPAMLHARVERLGVEIFQITQPVKKRGVNPGNGKSALPIAAVAGASRLELPGVISAGAAGDLNPEIEGRRTTMRIAGRDTPVYLLEMKAAGDYSIRAWLTEAGEPLRIATSAGQEAVAETILGIEGR